MPPPPPSGWLAWALNPLFNAKGPKLWYTDSCCQEEALLLDIFRGSLEPGRAYDASALSHLSPLPPIIYACTNTEALSTMACELLSAETVLGFDAEWPISLATKVATVQLSSATHSFVFQLRYLISGGQLHAPLARLLASESVLKVGVGARGDATRLRSSFTDCVVNGVIDIDDFAREKGLEVESYSLSALTRRVLRATLDKPADIRLSAWDAAKLSEDQIRYAAADAHAGRSIYIALRDGNVPELPEVESTADLSLSELEAELWRLMEASVARADAAEASPSTSPAARATSGLRAAASSAGRAGESEATPPVPPQPSTSQPDEETRRYCSILLDILHAMQRLEKGCSTTTDPLFGLFMRKVKEAFFVKNADDVNLLLQWLQTTPMSAEDVKKLPSSYVHERVRRHVPPPAELALRLARVIRQFEPMV